VWHFVKYDQSPEFAKVGSLETTKWITTISWLLSLPVYAGIEEIYDSDHLWK
jgi:hypothetical protein